MITICVYSIKTQKVHRQECSFVNFALWWHYLEHWNWIHWAGRKRNLVSSFRFLTIFSANHSISKPYLFDDIFSLILFYLIEKQIGINSRIRYHMWKAEGWMRNAWCFWTKPPNTCVSNGQHICWCLVVVLVCVSAIKIRLRVRLLLYVCNAYTNWHSIASAPFI